MPRRADRKIARRNQTIVGMISELNLNQGLSIKEACFKVRDIFPRLDYKLIEKIWQKEKNRKNTP